MKNPIYAGFDLKTRQFERKLRFIEAGIQLMGLNGYRSATVRALCAEAGLTERYFYQSFQNTEALLIAIINHLTGNFMKRLAPVFDEQVSDQQHLARQLLTAYFNEVQNPAFARITLIEILGVSEAVDQTYTKNLKAFSGMLTHSLYRIHPNLKLSEADQEIIGIGLAGSVVMSAAGWMLQGYPYSVEQMVSNCLHILSGTAHQLANHSHTLS